MKIKDFFTKQDKTFTEGAIKAYLCGPTVYNHAHIGNVRAVILFDVLNRNTDLDYVHNITDIDDKIIARAEELGITEKEVSDKYTKAYLELLESLKVIIPSKLPKVTENIEGIIEFISKLIDKGLAYASNGNVYFSVNKLENYGKIANLNLDTLIDEEEGEGKEFSKDFAIWKSTDKGIKFASPWGEGRPGWHTECSHFIDLYFGEGGIDIHGGGIDLKFPHHVNEMAQFEALHEKEMNNQWLYVGHVNMDNTKMSKSLGNTILAKDFIEEYGADVLRYILLSTSYLKPINVDNNSIENAVNTVNKIKNALLKAVIELDNFIPNPTYTAESKEAILDDLNTSKVFTNIFEKVSALNTNGIESNIENNINNILGDLSLIGIEYTINTDVIKALKEAKENKDYELVDKLRQEVIVW